MTTLREHDTAPEFELLDATGTTWRLADFAGSKVIIYFYPAALTPGCTIEAVDFTTRRGAFADAGYAIVGISPDSPEKLARFVANKSLTVALLSDPDRTVIDAYGAWGTKMMYGKEMHGVIRSTFVVDVDGDGHGTVVKAMYNVKAAGHVERLARDLGVA